MADPYDISKVQAEIVKLQMEAIKLQAEAGKLTKEAFWYPVGIATGLVAAVSGATVLILKVFGAL